MTMMTDTSDIETPDTTMESTLQGRAEVLVGLLRLGLPGAKWTVDEKPVIWGSVHRNTDAGAPDLDAQAEVLEAWARHFHARIVPLYKDKPGADSHARMIMFYVAGVRVELWAHVRPGRFPVPDAS